MPKNAKILLVTCFLSILGLLTLQVYWIVKYYHITLNNFEREANIAFEDAIRKEFSLRCDTVQKAIEERVLDTNYFRISAELDKEKTAYIYSIQSRKKGKDLFNSSFSVSSVNQPLNKGSDSIKVKIAKLFAQMIRSEDLENHIVYYRTQDLGKFMVDKTAKFDFDTTRLRPILDHLLKQRGIKTAYAFSTRVNDSLSTKTSVGDSLKTKYAVVTKAFPTYNYLKHMDYVRVVFKDPASYVIANMWLILVSSVILIVLITGLIIFILKTLFKEKRLHTIKNDFISNITHEFKTPISTISAATESLRNEAIFIDIEKRNRYLGYVKSETEKLNLLVDTVLDLSLYENEKVTLKKEQIDIDEAIEQFIHRYQISANKRVDFEFTHTGLFVLADKTQFYHAVNNVIDNAVKYSHSEARISITVVETADFLQLAVSDQGIGINSSDVVLVFDKFYRVTNGNKHTVKGYGLGLNYVKQIMEAHHGWYKMESKLNIGTTLTLAWPK